MKIFFLLVCVRARATEFYTHAREILFFFSYATCSFVFYSINGSSSHSLEVWIIPILAGGDLAVLRVEMGMEISIVVMLPPHRSPSHHHRLQKRALIKKPPQPAAAASASLPN